MTGLAFADLLIHTCEVRRRTQQADRFGQPVEPNDDTPVLASWPCRLSGARGGERFQERSRDVVGEQFTLFLPVGANIVEADRVTVHDAQGGLLLHLGNVTYVKRSTDATGYHHVEAAVEAVRAGTDARPG